MNNLVVIPQHKQSIIARIENNTITEIGKIDVSMSSKSIITENNLIVSLCSISETLQIHNLSGDLLFKKENTNYKAINFRNSIVYLGGEYKSELKRDISNKGEMFSVMNLDEINFDINSMDLPIKVIEGKSIDDILINGNDLILVDNIIYPKYLIKYDISSPITPIHIETIGLPNNGTYEHIIKGDMNNDWLILYSYSVGRDGSSEHITITGKTKGSLHTHTPPFLPKKQAEKSSFMDIALIRNHLYILREDGLGFIDLNKKISNESFEFIKTSNSNLKRIIKSQNDNLIAIYDNFNMYDSDLWDYESEFKDYVTGYDLINTNR